MDMAENTIWAIMAGGVLSLVLLAAADTVVTRSLGAARNMLLIFAIGSTCILLSGLPETLFPGLPERLMMALKAGFGLLSSALGLRLLGIWTGGDREDHLVYRLTVWGAYGMLIAALVMTVLATLVAPQDFHGLLMLTAGLNTMAVALCMVIAVRAALLGDPLARWLVLACLILTGLMAGLYLHALKVPGIGLGLQALTAASAVLFLLIVMVLIVVRNRQLRQLVRLSRLEMGWDPATGLPTGAKLLSEVEHVFWRTGRLHGHCVVVGIYLSNLYELGDSLGRTSDNQILAATAARIRRAAGFRCVVGIYPPALFHRGVLGRPQAHLQRQLHHPPAGRADAAAAGGGQQGPAPALRAPGGPGHAHGAARPQRGAGRDRRSGAGGHGPGPPAIDGRRRRHDLVGRSGALCAPRGNPR